MLKYNLNFYNFIIKYCSVLVLIILILVFIGFFFIYFFEKDLVFNYILINKKNMLTNIKEITIINEYEISKFESMVDLLLVINLFLILAIILCLVLYYLYKDRYFNVIKYVFIGVVFVCIYDHFVLKDLVFNLNDYLNNYIELHVILNT